MAQRIERAMDMTTLAVLRDDTIPLCQRETSPQGFIKGSGLTGCEAQERTQRAKQKPGSHDNASWNNQRTRWGMREKERETGFEPATFSLGS